MASYYEFFKINVEGSDKDANAICEAIKSYAPDGYIERNGKAIVTHNLCKIADEEDASNLVCLLAKAANGASFTMEGSTECSVSGEMMNFAAELANGKLTLRYSEWYTENSSSMLEEYDTFEEYVEDYGDGDFPSAEEFEIAKKQLTFNINGDFALDVPYVETVNLEF